MAENEVETALKSPLDEKVEVTLTRFELKKIRDWNRQRMDAAVHALENMMMKPAKRSRWAVEYDFHSRLCDRLYGVDPDEEDIVREHNAQVKSQIEYIDEVLADIREKRELLKKQLV